MSTQHDCQLRPVNRILAVDSTRVENNAERALRVLLKGDGLRDQVAEAGGVEVRSRVEEVYRLDGDEGCEGWGAEGRDC
jgi:hypothetical protein